MEATIDRSETDQAEPRAWPARAPDFRGLAGFSEEDILYNRTGQLSPTQRRQLRSTLFWDLGLLSIPLAAIVAMSAWGFNTVLAIWCLCFLLGVPEVLRIANDFRAGTVAVAEGNAWTEFKHGGDDPDEYWLHIGDLKLETTSEAYKVIRAGAWYRVFYVPASKRLVGAELLLAGERHVRRVGNGCDD